jgi:hypothetical protein
VALSPDEGVAAEVERHSITSSSGPARVLTSSWRQEFGTKVGTKRGSGPEGY